MRFELLELFGIKLRNILGMRIRRSPHAWTDVRSDCVLVCTKHSGCCAGSFANLIDSSKRCDSKLCDLNCVDYLQSN